MSDYAGIIKRLEGMDKPDFAVNKAIYLLVHTEPKKPLCVPPYTSSIDAAVALVERMLPGSVWHVMTDYGGLNRAKIGPAGRPSASVYTDEDAPLFMQADAETPVLALLIAMFRALQVQEDDDDLYSIFTDELDPPPHDMGE